MGKIYAASNDGYVEKGAPSFAGARDASSGDTADSASTREAYAVRAGEPGGGGTWYVNRTFMAFDTSGISTAPDYATLKIRGYSGAYADVIVLKADAPADLATSLATSDFDAITGFVAGSSMSGNVTEYSSVMSSWSSAFTNSISLNAAALADMASGSVFKICIVEYNYDYLNNSSTPANNYSGMYYQDRTGTSYDPYIEYPTTYIVKQDGTGDYTTIADALSAAANDDIIEIQDSETYNEGNLYKIATNLTIRAAAGQTPIMDGQNNYACALRFYTGWRIQGITVTNYDGTTGLAANGAGFISASSYRRATIVDCTIYNVSDNAIEGLADNSVVENCKIYNVTNGAAAITTGTSYNIAVRQCLIYDISGTGIYALDAGTVIEQCTVYNVGYNGSTNYGVLTTNGTAKWNIIVNPLHNSRISGLRAGTHEYNCVSGSEGGTSGNIYGGAGTGDIETDPLINSSSFRIEPGSPCIAAAVGSTRSKDFLSGSRNWNYNTANKVMGINAAASPHDMGAIEFNYTTINGVDTENVNKVLGVS